MRRARPLGDAEPSYADARWMNSTATFGLHGTPAYMSPEQLDGREESDARSDQLNFGVALYEAIYRAHPFALWLPQAPATLAELRRARSTCSPRA